MDVYFYAKGRSKSQVAVEHRKLASADATRMKAFWSSALARLKERTEA